jgi:hypothetical protein
MYGQVDYTSLKINKTKKDMKEGTHNRPWITITWYNLPRPYCPGPNAPNPPFMVNL